ncbi:MAG: hypothetical protein ACR2PM_04005, partial [Hyphomicrobiales bacterium]
EAIPVDIVTIEDFTKLKAQVKKPPQEEKKPDPPKPPKPPEPEKPVEKVKKPDPPKPKPPKKVAALPPAPAPEPEPVPQKPPEPKPAEPAPPEPAAVPDKAVEPPKQAYPKPRVKPRPPKRTKTAKKKKKTPKFKETLDEVAALLDKTPVEETARPLPEVEETGVPELGDINDLLGKDNEVTASEMAALRAQIERCWRPPVAVLDAGSLRVRIKIYLKPNGAVAQSPEILSDISDPLKRVAAESAARAVLECKPYNMPEEKYESWKEVILNFDPRDMLRGG